MIHLEKWITYRYFWFCLDHVFVELCSKQVLHLYLYVDVKFSYTIQDKENARRQPVRVIGYGNSNDILSRCKLVPHSSICYRNQNGNTREHSWVLHCEITILENKPPTPADGEIVHDPKEGQLVRDHANLLTSGKFSDFTIVCESQEFPCHKLMLAMRLLYFLYLFQKYFHHTILIKFALLFKISQCIQGVS